MILEVTCRSIMCDGCAGNITEILSAQKGIQMVKVDVPAKKVVIEFNEKITNESEIRKELAQIGYPAD